MTLDLSSLALIKAGSGVLFVLLGLAVLAVGPRTLGHMTLSGFLVAFGAVYVVLNLLVDPSFLGFGLALLALAGLAVPLLLPSAPTRREVPALILAAFASAICVLGEFDGGDRTLAGLSEAIVRSAAAAMVITWTARARSLAREERAVAGAFTLGLGLFLTFSAPPSASLLAQGHGWAFAEGLLLAFTAPVWVLVGVTERHSAATWTGLALLTATLIGMIRTLTVAPGAGDPLGLIGILRIVGWSILIGAIVHLDILKIRGRPQIVSRGSIAALMLAVFFIVAQVAENVLSANLGLLSGSIAAGALLFVAAPVQRAMERRMETTAAPASPGRADPARLYRHALRAALADGALTAREEEHLAALAEDLGLSHSAALRLRRDEEKEMGLA